MKFASKTAALALIAASFALTGCAGFKGTSVVGYQAGPGLETVTYDRATATSDFNACRDETKDGTVEIVLVPDSTNIDRQRRHKAGAKQVATLRDCMSAKGHTEVAFNK